MNDTAQPSSDDETFITHESSAKKTFISNKSSDIATLNNEKKMSEVINLENEKKWRFKFSPANLSDPFFENLFLAIEASNLTVEQALLRLDKARQQIEGLKFNQANWQILYLLYERPFYSFEQILQKTGLNRPKLAQFLDRFESEGIIKRESSLCPACIKTNLILKSLGENTKKRVFYSLNRENQLVDKYGARFHEQVEPSFIDMIQQEKKWWNDAKSDYEASLNRKDEWTKLKKQTPLQRILSALIPNVGKTMSFSEVMDCLCFRSDIISERKWKGRRTEHGVYQGGWESYLAKKGYIKIIPENPPKYEINRTISQELCTEVVE